MTEREFKMLRPGERVSVGGTLPAKKIRGTVLMNRAGEVIVQFDKTEERFPSKIRIFESGCRGYQSLVPKER